MAQDPAPRIAVLIETSMGFGRGVMRGVLSWLHAHGPWNLYFEPGYHGVPNRLAASRVDAVIARLRTPAMSRAVAKMDVPRVFFGPLHMEAEPGQRHPVVRAPTTDNHSWERWQRSTCSSAGFVTWRSAGIAACRRSAANRDSWKPRAAGVEVHSSQAGTPAVSGAWQRADRDLERWLQSLPKPVGILAYNDSRGRNVIDACHRIDIRVPDEVAVVGVDNDPLICLSCRPELSSVMLPLETLGGVAAQMIADLLAGKEQATKTTFEPLGVVARGSTDVLAIRDREIIAAVAFIREHLHEPISVPDVARHAVLARTVLERRFRAALGRSPRQEIERCRIERAKQLLSATDLPMPVIAKKCGFSSAPRLTETFRRQAREAPTSYRARMRQA